MKVEYEPDVFPLRARGPIAKPAKGDFKLDRKTTRAGITKQEEAHKARAKKRDGKCRLPFCPWCRAFKDTPMADQAAHVLRAKGMGGDPSLEVSQPEDLMRLDPFAHAAQERHEWAVEPLTEHGTNGPCEFYLCVDVWNQATAQRTTERVLWARESRIGVPDSDKPYTTWQPIRAAKEQD